MLLDTLGHVRGLETLTENVTPAQRRALAARDLGCAARGCNRPPAMTDVHHLVRRAGGAGQHPEHPRLGRRHHRQPVRPAAIEHGLGLVLEIGQLDPS